MIEKIKNKYNNLEKPNKLEIGLLIFILVTCFFLFNHGDLLATSTHGKDLLQVTLKGKFFSFYDYTEATAVYLIPIYILFAIWSIPVMIIYSIRGVNLWGKLSYEKMTYLDLMWYKLLPVIFCILTCIVLYKIVKLLKVSEDRKKWLGYLFFSFPVLVFSQFIFGGYDSFSMFFTTLSLYYFLDKKYYKFSILMSVAITFKLFPIFIFIPLLLLVEKRVIHIVKYCLIAFIGTMLSNLLFIGSNSFMEAKKFTDNMVDRLFVTGFHTSFGMISLFLVIFFAICAYCYLYQNKNDKEFNYIAIYICLLVYSILFVTILWHPQWVILLVPFWVLMMMMSDNIKTSYILSIMLCISYLAISVIHFTNNVDDALLNHGILPIIFGRRLAVAGHFNSFFLKNSYLRLDTFITIFSAAILVNLILKYPNKERLEKYVKGKNKDMPEKGYILGLLSVILLYIIPAIYFFIKYLK